VTYIDDLLVLGRTGTGLRFIKVRILPDAVETDSLAICAALTHYDVFLFDEDNLKKLYKGKMGILNTKIFKKFQNH